MSNKRFALVALSAAVAAPVMAAVPTGAQDIFTDAATDFGTIAGWGFTCMAVVVGGLIVFKLIRKVANKAT